MDALIEILPWLLAMLVLIAGSAFFSASEAALFYLRAPDRRELASGGAGQRVAARLLQDPERLLSAVLFWNLVINIAYFAVATIAAMQLRSEAGLSRSATAAFAIGTLLTIIFCSEMLPKSVAVLRASRLAGVLSPPLSIFVRLIDPVMPLLRLMNLLSRRLIWPRFKPEPELAVSDLERAVELSTHDAQLVQQEQAVLTNIVMLSDIRVDEWMRPRTQFRTFRPPVSLADLEGQMTPSGYLLVAEPDSEEVQAAINLQKVYALPRENLETIAAPVWYAPWCTTVADALQQMQQQDCEVVAVVNEFGETIGILTFDDILDTVFTYSPSRSKRLLDQNPIHFIEPGKWLVAGVTPLRRLARILGVEVPASKSMTIAGVIQETLERLAVAGDECSWGPFCFRVLEVGERGHMIIEMTWAADKENGR